MNCRQCPWEQEHPQPPSPPNCPRKEHPPKERPSPKQHPPKERASPKRASSKGASSKGASSKEHPPKSILRKSIPQKSIRQKSILQRASSKEHLPKSILKGQSILQEHPPTHPNSKRVLDEARGRCRARVAQHNQYMDQHLEWLQGPRPMRGDIALSAGDAGTSPPTAAGTCSGTALATSARSLAPTRSCLIPATN